MKNIHKHSSKKAIAKGDRLEWTPLENVKSVKLTTDLTKGRLLTLKDLEERAQNGNSNHLVP